VAYPLVDTQAIAVFTRRKPATIRTWARRYPERLPRRGRDKRGRTLYAIEDAETLMTHLNLDNGPDVRQHLDDLTGSVSCPARALP
jgi:hypothetical protein